jgi:type I restriction enzyme S subunit
VRENSIQYPDRLFCATLKDKDHARYLEIYFSSPKFGQYIASTIKSSAGHQRITIDVLKSAALRLPSIEEQKYIVRMVDELLKKAGAIEKKYLYAKEKVDRLTQSILGNAFTGELVSQDPTDEPAEKLLARIKTSNSNAKIKRK